MTRPKFDGTITLGHVLTMVSLLIGGAAGYSSIQISIAELRRDVQHFSGRIDRLEREITSLSDRLRALEMGR